jgi:hypothetical protein
MTRVNKTLPYNQLKNKIKSTEPDRIYTAQDYIYHDMKKKNFLDPVPAQYSPHMWG